MNLRRVFLAALALTGAALSAAPLTRDASVYAQPDPSSPVLKVLPAGTVPTPATATSAPEGWSAVALAGPHTVWVTNKSVDKELDIRPGTALYAKADFHSPVVGTFEPGDKAELIPGGFTADFMSFKLSKPIVGYVKLGTPVATGPAPASTLPPPAPVVTNTSPVVFSGIGTNAGAPRFFEGRFTTARYFLNKPPYNFQLDDGKGNRFAFLNVSRVTMTDKIDLYLDRVVVIYGTAHRDERPGKKDIVIEVESLSLK